MPSQTLVIFLLLCFQTLLWGAAAPSTQEKGRAALSSGLWELAEMYFQECLQEPSLAPELRPEVSFQLAEALIRGDKPEAALKLLKLPTLATQPALDFWRAQATASAGKRVEAIGIFSNFIGNPQAPYRREAVFSLANLLLTTRQPERALETLRLLDGENFADTAARSALLQTEILTELRRPADARAHLPNKGKLSESSQPYRSLLEAKILLLEGKPELAATLFKELIAQPMDQPLDRYEAAVLGLADALAAQENLAAASQSLVTFIQENPQSRQLAAMFDRLHRWLPTLPSMTDPVLETLAGWITAPELPALGIIAASPPDYSPAGASALATPFRGDERLAFSLFTRASGLHRLGTPAAKTEARRLLTRLRLENPGHPLVQASLYQLAAWWLAEGNQEMASSLLSQLRDGKNPTSIFKGEASFLEGKGAFAAADYKQATALFENAAAALPREPAAAARFNASIAKLRSGDSKGYQLIVNQAITSDPELAAALQLEQALTTAKPTAQRADLEKFLAAHPQHPRAAEARLALVEAALSGPEPDLPFVASAIAEWTANPALTAALPPIKLDLIRLRFADLSKDSATTLALANKLLEAYPADPAAADVALTLGRSLFEAKDYNQARLVLEKLATADPLRAQAAWLLAARAAALVGTSSSKEEAIILFDKAITTAGPLVSIASLEKADHLIANLGRTQEAAVFLEKWVKSLPPNDDLRLPAGLLIGQALYAQGTKDPASLPKALTVYDALLPFAKAQPALRHRLQYLRGLVLERLPDPEDPTKKRDKQAFIAYYSVLEISEIPPEWEYFELCGFKALSLLENSERWIAAVTTAQKIAAFKGPRAQEAADRANQIQLTHHIWQDITPASE